MYNNNSNYYHYFIIFLNPGHYSFLNIVIIILVVINAFLLSYKVNFNCIIVVKKYCTSTHAPVAYIHKQYATEHDIAYGLYLYAYTADMAI